MINCAICGSRMIWQSDFNLSDYGIEGEGLVAVYQCSACNTHAEFYYLEEDDNEDNEDNEEKEEGEEDHG